MYRSLQKGKRSVRRLVHSRHQISSPSAQRDMTGQQFSAGCFIQRSAIMLRSMAGDTQQWDHAGRRLRESRSLLCRIAPSYQMGNRTFSHFCKGDMDVARQSTNAVFKTHNQWFSLTDQLNMGVRLLELDVHWVKVLGLHEMPRDNGLFHDMTSLGRVENRTLWRSFESCPQLPSISRESGRPTDAFAVSMGLGDIGMLPKCEFHRSRRSTVGTLPHPFRTDLTDRTTGH